MTKKLNWKLKQLPTAAEVADLVHEKIITATEAKAILFTEGDDKDPSVSELKKQIGFLEELVKELSKRTDHTYIYKWVETRTPSLPNTVWCSTSTAGGGTLGAVSSTGYSANLLN